MCTLLAVASFGLALGALFWLSRATSVLIDADTETFDLAVASAEPLSWDVENFEVFDCQWLAASRAGRSTPRIAPKPVEARLVLSNGARVTVTRSATSAVVHVRVTAPPSPAADRAPCQPPAVASISSGGFDHQPLYDPFELRRVLDKAASDGGAALVLPLRGHVTVGDDVTTGVRFLLLSGRLMVVETLEPNFWTRAFGQAERYVASTRELTRGDRVLLRSTAATGAARDRPREHAVGFARVARDAPMTVSMATASSGVRVVSVSGPAREFRPTLWMRIQQEPVVSYPLALCGVLGALGGFLRTAPWRRRRDVGTGYC